MSVLKRRSRIVSFRLLEDEYRALENRCVSEGIRSISDLARSAVCRMIQRGNEPVDQTLEEELGSSGAVWKAWIANSGDWEIWSKPCP